MPIFRLHLHECDNVTLDEEGIERPDIEAARDAAIEGARDIMRSEVASGNLCLSCHIEVEDEAGAVVLKVLFKDVVQITGV